MMFQWKDRGGVFLFTSHVDGPSESHTSAFSLDLDFISGESIEIGFTEKNRREEERVSEYEREERRRRVSERKLGDHEK